MCHRNIPKTFYEYVSYCFHEVYFWHKQTYNALKSHAVKESFLQLPFKQHILKGCKKILSMLFYYLKFEDLYKKHYLLVTIMYFYCCDI